MDKGTDEMENQEKPSDDNGIKNQGSFDGSDDHNDTNTHNKSSEYQETEMEENASTTASRQDEKLVSSRTRGEKPSRSHFYVDIREWKKRIAVYRSQIQRSQDSDSRRERTSSGVPGTVPPMTNLECQTARLPEEDLEPNDAGEEDSRRAIADTTTENSSVRW